MILHLLVQVAKHDVVDIRSQMANRCIQKIQLVLQTKLFKLRSCGGIKLRSLAAILHIDLVHILHQLHCLLLANVLIQRAAEIVGNVIFSIRKCPGSAKTAHDRAALTAYTALDLFAVNRTFSFFERIALLKYSQLQIRFPFHQLICRKNASRTSPDNYHVISHMPSSFLLIILYQYTTFSSL